MAWEFVAAVDERVDEHGFIRPGLFWVKRFTEKTGLESRWTEYKKDFEVQNLLGILDGRDGMEEVRKGVVLALLYHLEDYMYIRPSSKFEEKVSSLAWISTAAKWIEEALKLRFSDKWKPVSDKGFFSSSDIAMTIKWLSACKFLKAHDIETTRAQRPTFTRIYLLTPEGADYCQKCQIPALNESQLFHRIVPTIESERSLLFRKPWEVYEHLAGNMQKNPSLTGMVGGD